MKKVSHAYAYVTGKTISNVDVIDNEASITLDNENTIKLAYEAPEDTEILDIKIISCFEENQNIEATSKLEANWSFEHIPSDEDKFINTMAYSVKTKNGTQDLFEVIYSSYGYPELLRVILHETT